MNFDDLQSTALKETRQFVIEVILESREKRESENG
jgi:hypothetical protein